ncbi:lipid-A-disaccharide synthase [Fibrobacter sp. UWEL]|nr:lipid-A-disaccharide synthase [Fibrobacter sp. UWEL]
MNWAQLRFGSPTVKSGKPYILFCAGEDSGDCLGESLVTSAHQILQDRLDLVGAGGGRMATAGLKPVVDYDVLPVSGFGDVLPKYFKLKKNYKVLAEALANPLCMGLVAIDYPGYNMKLTILANRLNKPVLYVAPPQAWAWKAKRVKKLTNPQNRLALFFDFEEKPYRDAGCNMVRMQHPLVNVAEKFVPPQNVPVKKSVLLLPGSRASQAHRNMNLFLDCAQRLRDEISGEYSLTDLPDVVVLASRESLQDRFQKELERKFRGNVPAWIRVELSPKSALERFNRYRMATMVLTTPGTSTLELALSGSRCVVCTCPDCLTYAIGKRLVKTNWFSLPNLILGKEIYPEFILWNRGRKSIGNVANALLENVKSPLDVSDVNQLKAKLNVGKDSHQLMSEFLAQFL